MGGDDLRAISNQEKNDLKANSTLVPSNNLETNAILNPKGVSHPYSPPNYSSQTPS